MNIFDFASEAKLTVLGVGKWQLQKVAFDFDGNVLNFTLKHSITHVVAHVLWQRVGQIAVYAGRRPFENAALQVQNAQAVGYGARFPTAAPFTAEVCVGHTQLPVGHRHPALLCDPLNGGLHLVQRNAGVFKDVRKAESAIVNRCFDLSPVAGHVKADVGIFNAWPMR